MLNGKYAINLWHKENLKEFLYVTYLSCIFTEQVRFNWKSRLFEASDPICVRVVFWARLRVYPEDWRNWSETSWRALSYNMMGAYKRTNLSEIPVHTSELRCMITPMYVWRVLSYIEGREGSNIGAPIAPLRCMTGTLMYDYLKGI